jgi:hypothetical protein
VTVRDTGRLTSDDPRLGSLASASPPVAPAGQPSALAMLKLWVVRAGGAVKLTRGREGGTSVVVHLPIADDEAAP